MEGALPDDQNVPFKDHYPRIKAATKEKWLSEWREQEGNKLRDIEDQVGSVITHNLS